MKYRKKPIVIDAVQWKGNNYPEIHGFATHKVFANAFQDNQLVISTLEGKMIANIGDWIIKGIKGEFYPIKEDIFEASYEFVEG